MFDFLKKLTGLEGGPDMVEIARRGGQIVDVRSPAEFRGGHIQGALNLPLQTLEQNFSKLAKHKPVITCCASGMRSGLAKSLLEKNGFSEVVNGGPWHSLQRKLATL